jgi:hypothetical protein
MEIDGHCYLHGVHRIEIETVTADFSSFVRIKIRGREDKTGELVSFACWGEDSELFRAPAPEVIVTESDERKPVLDHLNAEEDD